VAGKNKGRRVGENEYVYAIEGGNGAIAIGALQSQQWLDDLVLYDVSLLNLSGQKRVPIIKGIDMVCTPYGNMGGALLAAATITGTHYQKRWGAILTVYDDSNKHTKLGQDIVARLGAHMNVERDLTAGIGSESFHSVPVCKRMEGGLMASRGLSFYLDEAVELTPAGAGISADLMCWYTILVQIEWRSISDQALNEILRNEMLESA
jgi:hypothetical protein